MTAALTPARRALRVGTRVLAAAVGLGLLSAAARYGPSTPLGLDLLARLATGVRVGDLGWLKVEGVAGDPWTDFTVSRVEIADRRGVWLSARGVSAHWRAGDLWARRVRIDHLSARTITLVRQPSLLASGPETPPPVSVRIDRFATRLVMTPAFAWRRGDYLVEAALAVGRDKAVSGRLRAVSVTHPGDYLRVGLNLNRRSIALEAHALEAMGGALGGSLGLDVNQPFALDARAHGSPRAGWFALTTTVGAATPASATGAWRPAGGEASARIDLAASRWLAPWRQGVGPVLDLHLTSSRQSGGLYRLAFDGRAANVVALANGEIDPGKRRAGPRGVALDVSVKDLAALTTLPGLGPGRLTGRLTGDDQRWTVVGTASTDRLREAGFTLLRLSGPFRLEATSAGLSLKVDGQGAGGTGGGVVSALLGGAPKASAQVDWLVGGRVLVRRLSLQGAALDVRGQGARTLFGGLTFEGKATIHGPGVAGGGTVLADWRASQASDLAPWAYSLRAGGQGLHLGLNDLDAALGPKPEFTADGHLTGEGLLIDHARLAARDGVLTGAGRESFAGDLRLTVDWLGHGDLTLGPLSASGLSQASGVISGSIDEPRLDLMAKLQTITPRDYPAARLRDGRLALTLLSDAQGVGGRIGLDAFDAKGPARAGAAFRAIVDQIALTDIVVDVAGVGLRGSATLIGARPSLADLNVVLEPGVLLTAGRADGRLRITGTGEAARAKLSVKGAGLMFPGSADRLESLTLSADGPMARLPYRVEARGEVAGLAGRFVASGDLSSVKDDTALTFAGVGRLAGVDFRTLSPGLVTVRPGGVEGVLHLGVGKGRADVTLTRAGSAVRGHAVVAGLDLGVLDPDLQGRGDGVLEVTSLGGALVGSIQARVSGLSGRDSDPAAAMAGTLDATFGGGVIAARTALTDQQGSRFSADVRLPATLSSAPFEVALESRRPLSGRFSADGAIGPLWNLLEGGGRTLSGRLTAEGAISGTLADPRLTGSAAIDNGDFEDNAVGLRLKGITVRAAMKGDSIDVARFTATDGAKGTLSGDGRLSLLREGASGFRLGLKGFRLIDNALGQATATGPINVDRAADGKVRLSGALTIDRAQISAKAPNPSGVVPMEVVEIHRPTDLETPGPPPAERVPPVALDIALTSPGGVFIKGRGLNVEVSLDARVTGSTAEPNLSGVARVVRGDYDFAGKRFQIDDTGVVHLGPTLETVRLDITATRDDPTLTAVISIGGTAATPTLTLTSTPALPKDEILSQVLFGSSAAQLSGLQAAQLASAVAGLAGSGGFDVVGGLRAFAHLDRLAIDSAAATGFMVSGGKYVTDKLYVEVTDSARTGQGAQVEWRLLKHLFIVSRVTSQGDHAVSVRWRKDY